MVKNIYENSKLDFEKSLSRTMDKFTFEKNSAYDLLSRLRESMNYSLENGGKRLRPVIGMETFKMFDRDLEKYYPFAIAVEMIHTYSLIHDDLPAMDDDDYRRGQLTNHKKFGEDMAILAGDSLLNMSFEIMLHDGKNINSTNIDDYKRHILASEAVAKYSGQYGMIGGQVVDVFSKKEDMNDSLLKYMYETKTAGLFKAAIVSAGIIGGASEKEIEILEEFGNLLGVSYQIQDDLLDLEEDREIGKITYVSVNGLEKAKSDMEDFVKRGLDCLDLLDNRDTYFLENIIKDLVGRDK